MWMPSPGWPSGKGKWKRSASLLGLGGSFEMDGLFEGIMGHDVVEDGADI